MPSSERDFDALTVRPGPQQVLFEDGAYSVLPAWLRQIGTQKVLILHRDLGYKAALPYLPDLSEFNAAEYYFEGECSHSIATKLSDYIVANDFDAIVAIGGGKILDTAKAAAVASGNTPVFLLPTLASNCAPYSTISVYYTSAHEPDGFEVHAMQPTGLLIEPRVILTAPLDTLIAGIGDTLAKWYECVGGFTRSWSNSVSIAKSAALLCRDIPLEYGQQAIADHHSNNPSTSWARVVETIIVTAGLVGAFGGDAGRATGAHAVANGLVVHRLTTHVLHGTQVAYGILVQLALEHRGAELADLKSRYPDLGLPTTLSDVGILAPVATDFELIAREATTQGSTIHALHNTKTDFDSVVNAISELQNQI